MGGGDKKSLTAAELQGTVLFVHRKVMKIHGAVGLDGESARTNHSD